MSIPSHHVFNKVFRALADPSRREVLAVVARSELPVGEWQTG